MNRHDISPAAPDPEGDTVLLELFRRETEPQLARVIQRLLELEQAPANREAVRDLMRVLHSLKGAARVVGLSAIVSLCHAMEECLARVMAGRLTVTPSLVDVLMHAADRIQVLAREATCLRPDGVGAESLAGCPVWAELQRLAAPDAAVGPAASTQAQTPRPAAVKPGDSAGHTTEPSVHASGSALCSVAGRAEQAQLDRLLRLASQIFADARWLGPFLGRMRELRLRHLRAGALLDGLDHQLAWSSGGANAAELLQGFREEWRTCGRELDSCAELLGAYEQRCAQWSHRLYLAVLEARVRPFAEATRRLPRLVRDLARAGGKDVTLVVSGGEVRVDRAVLERVEELLLHLVRNAVDHGCEPPQERVRAGKPPRAIVRVEAELRPHELCVRVADDGRGVDTVALRRRLIESGQLTPEQAASLPAAQLLHFLFQPGLTLKPAVTADSGRGVGLDVVHQTIREMRGDVEVNTTPGGGTTFVLHLPLTLSVIRAVVVETAGELYAFPLPQVRRLMRLHRLEQLSSAGCALLQFNGETVPVVSLQEVLGLGRGWVGPPPWWLVVAGEGPEACAWQVDHCLGEQELTLQALDPLLQGLPGVTGAAVLEDGRPVLVLSTSGLRDLWMGRQALREAIGQALTAGPAATPLETPADRRVLVVDGSPVERDRIRSALTARGYETDEARDGWEAWRAVRTRSYAMVLAATALPGMDGLELTRRLRRDPRWFRIPVLLMNRRMDPGTNALCYEAGANACLEGEALEPGAIAAAVDRFLTPG